jgi:Tfp pilus assembly protein PilF
MPMALGSYQQLPALSLDAHFDLGLLHLAAGDPASALKEADTIRQAAATHLFAFVLRARAFEVRGDTRGATQAYRDFLKNEPAERARRRPEYAEHSRILDAIHDEAVSKTQGRPGS